MKTEDSLTKVLQEMGVPKAIIRWIYGRVVQ